MSGGDSAQKLANTFIAETIARVAEYAGGIMRSEGDHVLDVAHMNAALGVAGLQGIPPVSENNGAVEVTRGVGRFESSISRRSSPWIDSVIEKATRRLMREEEDTMSAGDIMKQLFSEVGEWTSAFVIQSIMRRLNNDHIALAIESGAAGTSKNDIHPRDSRNYIRIPEVCFGVLYGALRWIMIHVKGCDVRLVLTELVPVVTSRLVMDGEWVPEDRQESASFLGMVMRTYTKEPLLSEVAKTTTAMLEETMGDASMHAHSRRGAALGLSNICTAPHSLYAAIAEAIVPGAPVTDGDIGVHMVQAMHRHLASEAVVAHLSEKDGRGDAYIEHINRVSKCLGMSAEAWQTL